jgi:hypothetical protein
MIRYTVHLVATRQETVTASSLEAAEAVALTAANLRWPGLSWLVSDTEEEL